VAGITDSGQCFSRTREFAVRKHWARSNVAVEILAEFPKGYCFSAHLVPVELRIWRVKPWGFESPLSHQTYLFVPRSL